MAFVRALVVFLVVSALVGGIAWALAPTTATLGGVPASIWVAVVALGVNWLVFIPAAALQSERFYDATGSLSFLAVVGIAGAALPEATPLRVLPLALVGVWTLRLGSFLVARIQRAGSDGRFDEMKKVPSRFFIAWTLQGLWVFLTALAAVVLATSTAAQPAAPTVAYGSGLLIWIIGFGCEVIADRQKGAFSADPANRGKFIRTGLWAWSRHPNYFGEILLWAGLFVMGAQVWTGAQWLVVLSPVFVAVLLIKVSGIPLLEQRADKKWGGDADYVAWRNATPVLVPRPPRA